MRNKQNKLVHFTSHIKPEDTRLVNERQILTLKCSCKLIKTNSSFSNHIITYRMKYIANIAIKSCEIFLVLNLALKLSSSLQQLVNQIIYE